MIHSFPSTHLIGWACYGQMNALYPSLEECMQYEVTSTQRALRYVAARIRIPRRFFNSKEVYTDQSELICLSHCEKDLSSLLVFIYQNTQLFS